MNIIYFTNQGGVIMKLGTGIFITMSIAGFLAAAPVLNKYEPDPTTERSPTLEWTGECWDYKIEISKKADFASPFITASVSGPGYTPDELPPGRNYWRVSCESTPDDFSLPDDFWVTVIPEIQVARQKENTKDLEVQWEKISGCEEETYTIDLARDPDFENIIHRALSSTGTHTYTDAPTGDIYIRVRLTSCPEDYSPTIKVTIVEVTGISSKFTEGNNVIKIASNNFTLPLNTKSVTLVIFDLKGRELVNQNVTQFGSIDHLLPDLPKGVYITKLSCKDGTSQGITEITTKLCR